jgi:hypothetical protein
MLPIAVAFSVFAVVASSAAPSPQNREPAPAIAELWQEPTDLAQRDLFAGPWPIEHAPDSSRPFRYKGPKKGGTNPGMVVDDERGREWHVKQGREAGPEVVVSRILSALGYHQPPVYFLPSFTVTGGPAANQPAARFRLTVEGLKHTGTWRWEDNPFAGTPPYQSLLVVLVIMNSADLKNANNALYEPTNDPHGLRRWFVVRDLGTSFGQVRRFAPSGNKLEVFERHPFIEGISDDGYVRFDYSAVHNSLTDHITPADVQRACASLSKLSEQQWIQAFRAGGYPPDLSARFINRIHQKIGEGLRVATH